MGVIGHLLHFGKGDLMVLTFDILHDDFGGQNTKALLIKVESHVEVAEIFFVERIFTDADVERASIALVTLEQGFA